MTQTLHDCDAAFLRVVKAMEDALREASGENAPPLPPLLSISSSSSSSNQQHPQNHHTAADPDTAHKKRENWEQQMNSKLTPLAQKVHEACGQLSLCIGELNESCVDERRCEEERQRMVRETAELELQIVGVYSDAARAEEKLVDELKSLARDE